MTPWLSPGYFPVNGGTPGARLRLQTLGGHAIWLGSTPLTGTATRRRLVAFLALVAAHGAAGVSRDKLLAYLWPESDTAHARNSLKQVLFWARRLLKAHPVVLATGDVLRLDPAMIHVDTWEFEAAFDRGAYEEAVAIYRGAYLDGFHLGGLAEFEEWSEAERARLARRYIEALEALALRAERAGDAQSAVGWWRRLVEADPLSSSWALGMMRAMVASGDPTGALEQFQTHSELVRAELDCPPAKELLALAETLSGGAVTPGLARPARWSRRRRGIAYARPPEAPAVHSARPRPRDWLLGGLGLLLLITGDGQAGSRGGALPGPGASAQPFTVLPFAVTGAPQFGDLGVGLSDLVAARLDGVGVLRRVPVSGTTEQWRLPPGERLDPVAGATFAGRVSARFYTMGQLIADSVGLQATATTYDRGNANARVARAEARATLGAVFDLADDLASQLIAQMYEGPDRRLTRTAATSTRSLPALKAYLEGQRSFRADSLGAAVDAFRRAVRADTTFSLAYYRLSLAAELAEEPELALWAATLAARFSAGLTDYERELIEAYLVHRRGRIDEAERLYRRIVAEHPADPEGWSRLAELLLHSNPLRGRSTAEAREPLTRLLSLNPDDPEVLIYLARVAALQGNQREADTLVRRAVALTPDSMLLDLRAFRVFVLRYRTDAPMATELLGGALGTAPRAALAAAVHWGDLEGTEYAARRLATAGPSCEMRSLGHRMLAQVLMARGRPHDARRSLQEAQSCGVAASLELRAAYAALPFLPLDTVEIAGVRAELAQTPPVDPSARAYAQGVLALRLGDNLEANRALAELSARLGPATLEREHLLRSLRARLAAAEGRPRVALARLESVHWEQLAATPAAEVADRFLRAELLATVGRTEEALAWFGSLAQRSSDELVYLAPAELRQAEIYDRLGDGDRAVEHYRRFIHLWPAPEAALLATVERARTRLEALGH
jgi:DNA-binding SARP family transcriptional activator